MNPALLYRQHGRSIFWIAFVSALAVHIGAVAFAKTKSPTARLEDFSPLGAVVVDIAETEPALEESVTPLPLEEIHPDQDSFTEEVRTPPPVRAHRKARPVSILRGATTASLRSVKAMVAYAPRPVYPYEARRQRVTGSGIALVTVDQALGTVTDVFMTQSCGNAILDNSTLDALRRWRFKPGNVTKVQVPITYTLMGVSY
jgi:TonB family protein